MTTDAPDNRSDPIALDTCLELLRAGTVGRVATVHDGFPVIVPVNYRLAETAGRTWIAFRTRPGNVIERSSIHVAFEIDDVDPESRTGWSVLVRGTLHHVDPDVADFRERFDSHPWLVAERDAWMIIEPFSIEGRRLQPLR